MCERKREGGELRKLSSLKWLVVVVVVVVITVGVAVETVEAEAAAAAAANRVAFVGFFGMGGRV